MFCRLVDPEDHFKRVVVFFKEVQAVVILRQSTNSGLLIVSTRCRWCFLLVEGIGDGFFQRGMVVRRGQFQISKSEHYTQSLKAGSRTRFFVLIWLVCINTDTDTDCGSAVRWYIK